MPPRNHSSLKEKAENDPQLAALLHRMRIPEKLAEAGVRITEWSGHLRRGEIWYTQPSWWGTPAEREKELLLEDFSYALVSEEDALKIEEVLTGGPPLEELVSLGTHYHFKCHYCNEKMELATDGTQLKIIGEPCRYPDGIPYHDIELNVPSGLLVIDDNLTPWYPDDPKLRNINDLQGKIQMINNYAALGLAMGYVGNAGLEFMPVIGQQDQYVFGFYVEPYDKELEKYIEDDPDRPSWGDCLASVCTDLWWYSVADGRDFARRLAHYTPELTLEKWLSSCSTHNTVKVRPGVYRFRWFPDVDNGKNAPLYAEITWIREPDPVVAPPLPAKKEEEE